MAKPAITQLTRYVLLYLANGRLCEDGNFAVTSHVIVRKELFRFVSAEMTERYLFRLDGSRDNDEFFKQYSSSDCRVTYSGTPIRVGPGWIPDLVEITIVNDGKEVSAVLIELEATRISAMESARKYLPENPAAIIQAVTAYLETVITQCQVTTDPRLKEIEKLRTLFSSADRILVFAGAGVRDSGSLFEVLPLLDQQTSPLPRSVAALSPEVENLRLMGRQALSPREANGLRRTVRILDAVVTGRDYSGASFQSWRGARVKPLHGSVNQRPSATPELHRLLHKSPDKGIQLDLDRLREDLFSLWTLSPHLKPSRAQIAASVEEYFPLALSIRGHTAMRDVFREARQILEKHAK